MNFTPSKTIDRAGNLRRNQTEAEKKLWGYLHGGSLNGHKFTRQTPIAPHIVDFLCFGATISMFLRTLQASSMASFWNWKSVEIYCPSPLGRRSRRGMRAAAQRGRHAIGAQIDTANACHCSKVAAALIRRKNATFPRRGKGDGNQKFHKSILMFSFNVDESELVVFVFFCSHNN